MEKFEFSVSLLESYRKYEADEISEANFLESLLGTKVWSPQMQVGGAIHSIVEHGVNKYLNPATNTVTVTQHGVDGAIVFQLEDLAPIIEFRNKRPHMVHEVPVKLQFEAYPVYLNPNIPSGPYAFTINGRADIMDGTIIEDVKTTAREPEAIGYIDSCQWKCYLQATGCKVFRYQVFQTAEKKYPEVGYHIQPPMEITVYYSLAIQSEIEQLAINLVYYAANAGYLERLRPKITA